MKQNRNLVILLLIAVVGIVGVTIAYFSSTTTFENQFNTKEYGTTYTEEFVSPDNWLPGDTTDKTVTVTNSGQVDEVVRISLSETWTPNDANETLNGWIHVDGTKSNHTTEEELANDKRAAVINFKENSDWTKVGDYYYYNYKLAPGQTTDSLIESVTFNALTKLGDTCTLSTSNGTTTITCNSSGLDYDHATYKLTINIETVQYNKYKEAWSTDVVIISEQLKSKNCDSYQVGEEIIYNNESYFVLQDSPRSSDYITVIKKEPLTAEQVNYYSTDYVSIDGEYPYYESDTCNENNQINCSVNYDASNIRKIIDSWADQYDDDLKDIDGYKARIIGKNEINVIRSSISTSSGQMEYDFYEEMFSPLYFSNSNFYWTSLIVDDSNYYVFGIKTNYYNDYNRRITGSSNHCSNCSFWIDSNKVYDKLYIKPVINLKKKCNRRKLQGE